MLYFLIVIWATSPGGEVGLLEGLTEGGRTSARVKIILHPQLSLLLSMILVFQLGRLKIRHQLEYKRVF